MKVTELKRNLKELPKERLIKDIVDLFKKSEFVEDYYISKYGDDNSLSVLIKHKDFGRQDYQLQKRRLLNLRKFAVIKH